MGLLDYIRPMPAEELAAFAARCGTSVGQIRQVAYGRRASAELAIRIDIASSGAVPCEAVRPDVEWEYLRGSRCEAA